MEYLGENKPVNTLQPLVSVCIMTYQHGKYIKDCLEGAVNQQTSFPIEILVGEDESNDDTREICIEYAEKYPDKIRLFLRSRKDVIQINGRNTGRFNLLETLKSTRGKYLALCEGDDFWLDPLKLQKQADFLETHSDFSVCFHRALVLEDGMKERPSNPNLGNEPADFNLLHLAKHNFIHTPTVMYRFIGSKALPEWFNTIPVGDYALHLLHAQQGKVHFMPELMAAYRVHAGGLWSGLEQRERQLFWINVLNNFQEAGFAQDAMAAIAGQKRDYVNRLLQGSLESNWDLFAADLRKYVVDDEVLVKEWLTNEATPFAGKEKKSGGLKISRLLNFFRKSK